MSGGQLSASAGQYLAANGMNVAPPPISSDPLVAGVTPIEQLLRVLGLAANLGDPKDNTESIEEHEKRDSKTADAAAKFPAQDEQSTAEMKGVGADQMAQQLPQMASQLAGALAGAMGGALQPLAQIPQQLAQGAQQAMQAGMGMMKDSGGSAAELDKASLTDPLGEFGESPGEFGAGGGSGGGGGGIGGTSPTAMLGPPPVPSAGTAPSAANTAVPPPRMAAPTSAPAGGMGGMPMIPPGAMHGAGGSEKDAKADTKRVAVPTVKNGAPVQGRITTPPPTPQVAKKVDGKPVATRRIILPNSKPDEPEDPKS